MLTIGQRIAELRKQHGLSQEALGEALGVTRQSISKWESDSALPEIEKLIAMSRLFGVSVGTLLGVEEERAEKEGAAEGEFTEAQLRMVEEIVARYTAAFPKELPKPRPKWLLPACAAGACAFIIVMATLFSKLAKMDGNYRSLTQSINKISSNVNNQIGGIAHRVEEILNQQNTLSADFGCTIAEVNVKAGTVSFDVYAVPKTYEAGMTVDFIAESGGESTNAAGQEGETARFAGRVTCPLTHEPITVSAAFTRNGVRETQVLNFYNDLYDVSFPSVNVSGMGLQFKAAEPGVPFTVKDNTAFVHVFPLEKELPFAPEAPRIERLRVGLFKNRELLVWAEPEGEPGGVIRVDGKTGETSLSMEDQVFCFAFPPHEITVGEGDTLAVAAVVEDQFGKERVFADMPLRLFAAAGESTWNHAVVEEYAAGGEADWEY